MNHQTELLMAWLEDEGGRQRDPIPVPLQPGEAAARGWTHVRVCVLAGGLVAGLAACGLIAVWQRKAGTAVGGS